MSSADHPDISYLKSPEIGKVLAAGLAETYRVRPNFPVDFFAKWLLNYSKEQKTKKLMEAKKAQEKSIRQEFAEFEDLKKRRAIETQKVEEVKTKKKEEFADVISNAEYHDELLEETLPEGIFKNVEATAVYIGLYDFPTKKIDLNEIDDNAAHIDFEASQVITYIGGDSQSRDTLKGEFLPPDEGVTYNLFNNSQEDQQQQEDNSQDGENEDSEPKPNYIYVPDVVTNSKMHFFEIPRLGSYIAIPMTVNSYMNANSFDEGIKETKEFKDRVEQANQEKSAIKEEYEEKLKQAKENEDEEQYNELIAEYEEQEWPEPEPAFYIPETKNYVFCSDTLGLDKEISLSDRNYMVEIVNHFAKSWESKELEYLKADIERYINYESDIDVEEIINSYNDAEEREIAAVANELSDLPEEEAFYKQDEAKLAIVREQLTTEEEAKTWFLNLKDYRFIKMENIIQYACYLVGYKKEDINLPGTNVLNWRKVRTDLFNEEFFNKILNYEYKGAKEDTVPVYAYINRLKTKLEQIDQEEANNYNIGLGRLLRYLVLVTSCRIQDIQLRREDRIRRKAEREEKIHEKKARLDRKEADKQEAMIDLEEGEEFNEAEWLENWEEENPEIEIPEEVIDENDNDLEPDYFADEEEADE